MSRILYEDNWLSVADPAEADALIVNTCGFIVPAKKEAINAILELSDFKQPQGKACHLVVTGCLSQRYAAEIRDQLPEVDAVLGTADYGKIATLLRRLAGGEACYDMPGQPGSLAHLMVSRRPSTPASYAYIKIAEGCSNRCAYCAIPSIRGPLRSRLMEEIVEEAARLAADGYGELILIAQDTGRYGLDLYGRRRLPELLLAICKIKDLRLLRVLYTYSDGITDELLDVMRREPKIAHYLDMPIQHGSDAVLERMNRKDRAADIRATVARIRAALPDVVLRTTVMVGFPGETAEDFEAMLDLLRDMRFDRLGCFVFSPEEGTPAWSMRPRVHHKTAAQREKRLLASQQLIATEKARERIGQVVAVTLESVEDRGIFYVGRSYGEAPEVDPLIYVAAASDDLHLGQTCNVRLADADAYEMTGVTVL